MTPELLQLVFNIIAIIYMAFLGACAKTENTISTIAFKVIPVLTAAAGIALVCFQ